MALTIKALKKSLERAETVRRQWEPLFEECYDYALPNRTQFKTASQAGAKREGDRNTDYLFDQTAVVGIQEFASRLQYNMMPPFSRWASLVPGSDVPEDARDEIQEKLDAISELVFSTLEQSSFDQDLNEAFLDLAVSQGQLLLEESDVPGEILASRSAPLSNVFVLAAGDGKPGAVHFVEVKTVENILADHGDELPPEKADELRRADKDREIRVSDAFIRTKGSARRPIWTRVKFMLDPDCVIGEERVYEGEGSNPWVIFRWAKGSGESYGRGPLMAVLPSVRAANALMEFILEAAEWAVAGAYQADDDGVINPDTVILEPRAVIPRAPGSSIEPIKSGSDFNVGLEIIAHLQDAIKKGLYNERLGPREGTPPTAFEIQQRLLELVRDIGSSFGRLQAELARPVIMRVLYLLEKAGEIEMPRVDGRAVKIKVQSPLADAQRIEDVQNIAKFGEFLQGILGPQMAMAVIEAVETAGYIAERLMVPAKLVRSKEQTAALLNQILQQAAQAEQQQPAAPAAPIGRS